MKKLFHKAESYMQTDMRYITKGLSSLLSAGLIGSAGRFLISLALANWLTKETFGTYTYIVTTIELFAIFSLSGFNTALSQSVAKGYEGSMPLAMKTVIKWGSIGTMLSLGLGTYYFFQDNLLLGKSFIFLGFFIPFYKALSMYSNFLNGKKLFTTSAIYESTFHVLFSALFIGILYFTKDLFIILVSFFLLKSLFNGVLFLLTLKKHTSNKKVDTGIVSYGKHLSFIGFFASIASRIDKLILWHALGPVQVATYSLAMAPLSFLQLPIQKVALLALPKFAQKEKEEIQTTLPLKMLKAGFIMFIVVLVYILLAPYLFNLFYPEYGESVIYSQVLAVAGVLGIKKLLVTTLEARKEKRKLYVGKTVESATNLIGFIVLGLTLGIWGIVIATLITQIVTTCIYYKLFMLKSQRKIFGILV